MGRSWSGVSAGQVYLLTYSIVLAMVISVASYLLWSRRKRFKKQLKYLDGVIDKLDKNQAIGTLEEIIDKAP